MIVETAEAFALLRKAASGTGSANDFRCVEPPFERLRQALSDVTGRSALDRAVLLRHALRFENGQRGQTHPVPRFDLPTNDVLWPSAERWRAVGVSATPIPGGLKVWALPWQPPWLSGGVTWPVDLTATSEPIRRFGPGVEVAGDPFLRHLGHRNYRSVGQRSAVRAALAMPPGAALAVDLPTGEGKSTIFVAIAKIGFSGAPLGSSMGVTVVAVPTVTLALDHQSNAARHFLHHPLAYVGGRTDDNQKIVAAVRAGTQGLCFAAPEAICGPLRPALRDAARANHLRALIVDEAHLVDGWGTGFRTEFQLLGGVRRQLLGECSSGNEFRTVLLTATMSDTARLTLQTLFAAPDTLRTISGAMVRPEPEYWVAAVDREEVRNQHVLEALFHLPRPAILYVTTRQDADAWLSRLYELGYQNVRKVHGETDADERDAVLERWREGTLDLVVGTSAFGLGIDYPHVRTIVHACLPETFDRFYQEVGRSGRDGRASVSILLPSHRNLAEAENLNRQKVIGIEKGYDRWSAMFAHEDRRGHGHPIYDLRLDVSPGNTPERLDMLSERSTDWNARLLTVMARAGMIELLGTPDVQKVDGKPDTRVFQRVKILDEAHLTPTRWNEAVQPLREAIATGNQQSLALMRRLLSGSDCPGDLVAQLYRNVAHACPGCALCRQDPGRARSEGIVAEVRPPWPVVGTRPADPILRNLPLLVTYPNANPDMADRRRWCDAIRQLDRLGLRLCVTVGMPPNWLEDGVREATMARPWFVDNGSRDQLFPRGPRLILHGSDRLPTPEQFRVDGWSRIRLVPDGAPDPTRPDRNLADIIRPTAKLDQFIRTLNG